MATLWTEELSFGEGNLKNNCITYWIQYDLNHVVSVDIGKICIFHLGNSQVVRLRMKNVGHRCRMEKFSGKGRHLKEILWIVINNN